MAASPEFFQPSAAPAYALRLHLLATTGAADQDGEDEYYRCCRTPTGAGISFLGAPATCPPAPRKPRPPPTSACRKRLFAAGDIIALNFDDLEAVFRPAASLSDGKQPRSRRSSRDKTLGGRTSRAVGSILS